MATHQCACAGHPELHACCRSRARFHVTYVLQSNYEEKILLCLFSKRYCSPLPHRILRGTFLPLSFSGPHTSDLRQPGNDGVESRPGPRDAPRVCVAAGLDQGADTGSPPLPSAAPGTLAAWCWARPRCTHSRADRTHTICP